MESVRASAETPEAGNNDVFRLYWEFASHFHHDKQYQFDPVPVLATLGIDSAHAEAADDDSWDAEIAKRMNTGLELVGEDVGTPIIAVERSDGQQVGYFGPVITKIPTGEKATDLWDALMTMMEADGFFELKKTRQEMPDPGNRPEPIVD